MKTSIIAAFYILTSAAVFPAYAMDAPAAYEKCKRCHGNPGWIVPRIGPDLAASKYTYEQFSAQVKKGSNWPGKPPKNFRFRDREMPPVNISDAEIKAIFDYAHSK